ncbi:MAG: hypothetical protein SGI77_06400 [Pirellulaceae bacterium]|nr:hypothetical protein [Pirellulaceae bacterium]
MEYELEIYTSAESLLEQSSSGLGVVAKTRSFPASVTRDLSIFRYYTFLPELSLDQAEKHPPRIIVGSIGDKDRYSVIVARYFGADYSGRTTPTVHLATTTIDAFKSNCGTPAQLLAHVATKISPWSEHPKYLDPKPKVDTSDSLEQWPSSDIWRKYLSEENMTRFYSDVVDAMMKFEKVERPIVLVVPIEDSQQSALMLYDILALLPKSVQTSTIASTHLLTNSDFVRGSALGITYPGTEFHKQAVSRHDPRRPILVELTNSSATSQSQNSPYANHVAKAAGNGNLDDVKRLQEIWESGGFTVATSVSFGEVVDVLNALTIAKNQVPECVWSIDAKLAGLHNIPEQARSKIDKACVDWVHSMVQRTDDRGNADLIDLLETKKWPNVAIDAAAKHFCNSYEMEGLDALHKREQSRKLESIAIDRLIHGMSINPTAFWAATVKFLQKSDDFESGLQIAKELLGLPKITASQILHWLPKISGKSKLKAVESAMESKLVERLQCGGIDKLISGIAKDEHSIARVNVLTRLSQQLPRTQSKLLCEAILETAAKQNRCDFLEGIVPLLREELQKPDSDALQKQIIAISYSSPHRDWLQTTFSELFVASPPTIRGVQVHPDEGRPSSAYEFLNAPVGIRRPRTVDYWRRLTVPRTWIAALVAAGCYLLAIALHHNWGGKAFQKVPLRILIPFGVTALGVTSMWSSKRLNDRPQDSGLPNFVLQNATLMIAVIIFVASVLFLLIDHSSSFKHSGERVWLNMLFNILRLNTLSPQPPSL